MIPQSQIANQKSQLALNHPQLAELVAERVTISDLVVAGGLVVNAPRRRPRSIVHGPRLLRSGQASSVVARS